MLIRQLHININANLKSINLTVDLGRSFSKNPISAVLRCLYYILYMENHEEGLCTYNLVI